MRDTPTQGIYYVESPRDGRAIFVMPWRGNMLVGTTESRFRGDPETVHPLMAEKHYLVGVLRHYFPRHAHLQVREIIRFLRRHSRATGRRRSRLPSFA